MKVPDGEGPATHTGPESCATVGNHGREALTGERAGRVLSRERTFLRGADAVEESGRRDRTYRYREVRTDPTRSETPHMHASTSNGTRESPCLPPADGAGGRIGKSKDARR
jgi:hypothetical protein